MGGPVVIAAGGTGGHIFPAQSLAQELAARGRQVVLMTDDRGQNYAQSFPKAQIVTIRSATFANRGLVGKGFAFGRLALGALEAYFALGRVKPSVVVGFGGYPALPTMFAAARRGLPSVVHEQNAVLGRVNRWLSPAVTRIASAFPRLANLDEVLRARVTVTGNPVRPAVLEQRVAYAAPTLDGRFNLLVFGGSQGARVFSTLVPDAIALLPAALRARLDLTQQCRPEDMDAARARYGAIGLTPTLAPFFPDMGQRLAAAHLVTCRAGASTVTELCVVGRPAMLVPYPFAMDDHQSANAREMAEGGAAWAFVEKGLTAEMLARQIAEVSRNPTLLEAAAAKALSLGRPNAAARLADLVEEVGGL
ncbi:MAG: undecaprenyldiphospho-muramoylpentapeptide beta-N-acetylglucosaminyltransferase [Alphaproteobacteria bacterium]|nr:undecaprenyldiphospho-muramoylpentapeptide beta-N-acetylglucosaminyltransferase [Alphaproteobacteria bacterium]